MTDKFIKVYRNFIFNEFGANLPEEAIKEETAINLISIGCFPGNFIHVDLVPDDFSEMFYIDDRLIGTTEFESEEDMINYLAMATFDSIRQDFYDIYNALHE